MEISGVRVRVCVCGGGGIRMFMSFTVYTNITTRKNPSTSESGLQSISL